MVQTSGQTHRVILVTGSSSGIGKACCERLAKNPRNRVYGASRSGASGHAWTFLRMDVTDEASVAAVVSDILAREGRIDAIVHSAGNSLTGPIEDTSIAEAQRQFDTNYFGTVRMLRAILPVMRRQNGGQIYLIGSIGGLIGLPYLGHYSASKFALDGLVEALRGEIEPFGIEATIIHPGDLNTSFGGNRIRASGTDESSPHFARFNRYAAFYDEVEHKGGPPDLVARKVERLLARRRLPVRVLVGSALEVAAVWGKALMHARSFEFIFRKAHSP